MPGMVSLDTLARAKRATVRHGGTRPTRKPLPTVTMTGPGRQAHRVRGTPASEMSLRQRSLRQRSSSRFTTHSAQMTNPDMATIRIDQAG